MIWTVFIIGALTALGCGWNVMANDAHWQHDAVWSLCGLSGAGLCVLAILLRHWGY